EALLSFTTQAHLDAWLQGQREGWDVAPFVTTTEEPAYVQGERNVVLHLLKCKLGTLNDALEAQVASLNPVLLVPLSEALLAFTTQTELEAWLREQGGG
ncbi:DUF4351 domain-containing protein, partial [Candidatus Viridilinea mediisalina]